MKNDLPNPVPRMRADKHLLDRDAWLNAAADMVAEEGFGQLKILSLSKRLAVTRGSFYWHFKDHADLIAAFLDKWLADRIAEGQAYWNSENEDPESRLSRALEASVRPESDMKSLRIDLAVRDLARRHEPAAKFVAKLDKIRWKQSFELFNALLQDEDKAWSASLMFNVFVAGGKLILPTHLNDKQLLDYLKNNLADMLLGRAMLGNKPR
jgi:AcrR family transcriptional regulator